jgi:hypothetical protein
VNYAMKYGMHMICVRDKKFILPHDRNGAQLIKICFLITILKNVQLKVTASACNFTVRWYADLLVVICWLHDSQNCHA